MNLFSQRLRSVRKLNNVTQKSIALYLEIAEKSYQKYEYGNREPNYDTLIKLCNYFNVSSDYLLGLSDNPNSHKN